MNEISAIGKHMQKTFLEYKKEKELDQFSNYSLKDLADAFFDGYMSALSFEFKEIE